MSQDYDVDLRISSPDPRRAFVLGFETKCSFCVYQLLIGAKGEDPCGSLCLMPNQQRCLTEP
jgi:hypothetical protein